jgi:hypothetical protein
LRNNVKGVSSMSAGVGAGDEERRASAVALLAGWVESQPMQDLVEAFGEPWPSGSLVDLLTGLEDISSRHWDFRSRNNSERWEAESPDLSDEVVSAVFDSARRLGLVDESTPRATNYDAVAILGGGRQTPLVRSQFLADLIEKGEVVTPRVYLLGSPRAIIESERQFSDTYAPQATSEFDLMNAAGERAFGLTTFGEEAGAVDGSDHPYAQWRLRRYEASDNVHVTSISAPTSDLSRRPNTGDTYEWLMRHGDLVRGERVLLVTSAWFTAFQGFDAIRLLDLPHGLHTEIVGFGRDRVPAHVSPTVLLQEVRSGIRSALNLYQSASG